MTDAFSLRSNIFLIAFQHFHFFQDEVVSFMPNSQPGGPGFDFGEKPSLFSRCGTILLAPLEDTQLNVSILCHKISSYLTMPNAMDVLGRPAHQL